jgi:alanyl-tRNA synthetase
VYPVRRSIYAGKNWGVRSDKMMGVHPMNDRLYYSDSYLHVFDALIVDRSADGLTVYLDKTAFYPTSGGQPHDLGSIGGVAVVNVVDEDHRIAHQLETALPAESVDCRIDWARRFDHMQQHTGQHLLSAVCHDLFGLKTVSFHMGAVSSTIDVEGVAVDAKIAQEIERRANEIVCENRAVHVDYRDAAEANDLRKASEREGTLRIVSIADLDRSACGGTHVRATGEIGAILIRKLEKIRQSTRMEFLCGARAIGRARADYEALYRTAQVFRGQMDEVPGLVATQLEAAQSSDKVRRKLEIELAGYHGKELYESTAAGTDGLRRVEKRLEKGSLEELRPLATSFTSLTRAVFVASVNEPPSVMLAVSQDAGVDAGKLLKAALTEVGGRGGGTARMAQGSVADTAQLETVLGKLRSSIPS